MDTYRFDDAYEKVYEYNYDQKAYLFIGNYLTYGIYIQMSEEGKIRIVEEDKMFKEL